MDPLLDFILYMLAAIGLSHIIADGSILAPFKFWLHQRGAVGKFFVELMNCYQCNGFWSGIVVGGLAWWAGWIPPLSIFFWGLAISLVSMLVGYFKLYLALLTSVDEGDDEELLNE